jgi:alkylation response protein AidB-like acyl-CoA dehydrogenase
LRRTIFNEEHDHFRESVRGFLAREAVPSRERWEADGVIDREFWKAAAAQGFVAFGAPPEQGGAGLDDFRFNVVLDEEVVLAGIGTDAFSLTNDIVGPYLFDLTDEDQRSRWLPGVTDGSTVVAIAMSEPGTGSDLRGIKSTATRRGDAYVLQGSKTFVTSGIQADLVIVAAQVREDGVDGLGLFAVEATQAGFQRGRKLEKVGRKAQDTAELFFDDVEVPLENLIGAPGEGLRLLMKNLAQERLSMAVTAVANAERAFALTAEYAHERRAFGQAIGSFQANRFTLAEMKTGIDVARAFVDRCIAAQVAGELTDDEAAGAKFWTTDLEFSVLDRCLQLHGGYGYMEEYEVARRWRDSRVQRIYGGTNEIMKEIVGRSLGF